ncbi:MAG: ABC transporter permease [Spirochaetaceae bacterium]|jgi:ribose transport system permease protein|nr:ABC transporter permease [Spirochaetaceae bacterium]
MQFNISNALEKTKRININRAMVYVVFLIVLAIFAVWLGGTFFSPSNLLNISRQAATTAIMAVGMVFVIGLGQIDLSIGSVVALSAMIIALIMRVIDNIPIALIAGLLLGALAGTLNGLALTKLKIPSFLATLGIASIIRGIAMWTTGTKAVPVTNDFYNFLFGAGSIGPIPVLLFWMLAALILGSFALSNMAYGKQVLACGGNYMAAQYSGVKTQKVTMLVFIFMGMISALCGALYTGRMQTARFSYGTGVEMDVIAAVVLGGTRMSGGNGSVVGAIIGALLINMINNGLIIGGFDTAQQTSMKGIIIVLAVALGNIGKGKRTA